MTRALRLATVLVTAAALGGCGEIETVQLDAADAAPNDQAAGTPEPERCPGYGNMIAELAYERLDAAAPNTPAQAIKQSNAGQRPSPDCAEVTFEPLDPVRADGWRPSVDYQGKDRLGRLHRTYRLEQGKGGHWVVSGSG